MKKKSTFVLFVTLAGLFVGAAASTLVIPVSAAGEPGDLLADYKPGDFWEYLIVEVNESAAPWADWGPEESQVGSKVLFEVEKVNTTSLNVTFFGVYQSSTNPYSAVWGHVYMTDENGTYRAQNQDHQFNWSAGAFTSYWSDPELLSAANATFWGSDTPFAVFPGSAADWSGGLWDATIGPVTASNMGLDDAHFYDSIHSIQVFNSSHPTEWAEFNMTSDGRALKTLKHVRDGWVVVHVDLVRSGSEPAGWGVHLPEGTTWDYEVKNVDDFKPNVFDMAPDDDGKVMRQRFLGAGERGQMPETGVWQHLAKVEGADFNKSTGEWNFLPPCGPMDDWFYEQPDIAYSYGVPGIFSTGGPPTLVPTDGAGNIDWAWLNSSFVYMIEQDQYLHPGYDGGAPQFTDYKYDPVKGLLNYSLPAWDTWVGMWYNNDGVLYKVEQRNISDDHEVIRIEMTMYSPGKMVFGVKPGDQIIAIVDTLDPTHEYMMPADQMEGLEEGTLIRIMITHVLEAGCYAPRPWEWHPWVMFFDQVVNATVQLANSSDYSDWQEVMTDEFWMGFWQLNDTFEISGGPGPALLPVIDDGETKLLATDWLDGLVHRALENGEDNDLGMYFDDFIWIDATTAKFTNSSNSAEYVIKVNSTNGIWEQIYVKDASGNLYFNITRLYYIPASPGGGDGGIGLGIPGYQPEVVSVVFLGVAAALVASRLRKVRR
ncbi:MAG: hypothetical protein Kow0069_16900 [Promethearchaeota archaeon]